MTKVFIGVAWPYAYQPMHIGNVSSTFLPADILFRFHRQLGDEVMMVSGSDCHGTPVTLEADKLGISPEEVAEKAHKENLEILRNLNTEIVVDKNVKGSYVLFSGTNTQNHKEVTHQMFLKLLENGYIIKKSEDQLYDEVSKKFMQDRYIVGTCPHCGYDKARGDQCENCGRVMDSLSLINPISKTTGEKLVIKSTENYYLDLEKLSPKLESYLNSDEFKENNKPWIQKEAYGWVKEGLKPRAITREMEYGIKLPIDQIPNDKLISNPEKKVFYVWFEAVIGYLSAAIEFSKVSGNKELWKEFFYNKETKSYYVLGQDNVVFHTINWPAQLMAYDESINLPTTVMAYKYWLLEGKKLSKSNGWIIPWEDIFDNFEVDAFRFYMAHNMAETNQSNWSWEEFKNVVNGELVAKIGNFIHRILTFTKKNYGNDLGSGFKSEVGNTIQKTLDNCKKTIVEKGSIREYIQSLLHFAREANLYVDNNKFWELKKTDEDRCREVLFNCLDMVSAFSMLIEPICPNAQEKLDNMAKFGYESMPKQGEFYQYHKIAEKYELADEITPLFKKIEDEQITDQLNKLNS